MEAYRTFQDDFKEIFKVEDLSLFTEFNNMNYNERNTNNKKKMLWYLWQHCIRDIFKEIGFGLNLDLDLYLRDLTDIGLNIELPYSEIINL